MNLELNQASFRISEFLSKFLANVAEIMHLTIVLGQGIVIISFVILTILTSWMSILLVTV